MNTSHPDSRKGCKTCTYGYTATVAGIEWFVCDVSRAFREQIILKEDEIVEQRGCDYEETPQIPFRVSPGFDPNSGCMYYSDTAPVEKVRTPIHANYKSKMEAKE